MRVLATSKAQATLELTYEEVVLFYGGLVEAAEALSPSEFRARIGRSEVDADNLRRALKSVVLAMEGQQRESGSTPPAEDDGF